MKEWMQSKRHELALLGAAVLVVIIIIAIQAAQPSDAEKLAKERANARDLAAALASEIHYKVGGTTTQASITVQTPSGSSQQNDIDVPLKTKSGGDALIYTFQAGDFVYLSAQNSEGDGTVTCSIETKDGQVIASNSASGGYAIATCTGRAR